MRSLVTSKNVRWSRLIWPTLYSSILYVCELFDVECYRDLEIGVRGHSMSLKLVPFESFGAVCYSPSIVTMASSSLCGGTGPEVVL